MDEIIAAMVAEAAKPGPNFLLHSGARAVLRAALETAGVEVSPHNLICWNFPDTAMDALIRAAYGEGE